MHKAVVRVKKTVQFNLMYSSVPWITLTHHCTKQYKAVNGSVIPVNPFHSFVQ